MKVIVAGGTGNVGTGVVEALSRDGHEVIALARRGPLDPSTSSAPWRRADVSRDDLVPLFAGADAVVHLAWAIQPSRDEAAMRTTNIEGSRRVFRAAGRAGVPALVYASSVGAYSPGPDGSLVDEDWPTDGVAGSSYSRHKAYVERILDIFERDHPDTRIVRLRPSLIFKAGAASEIRRLFIGPLLPRALIRRRLIPFVPNVPGLRFQTVHSNDVAEAFRLAVTSSVRGAFNIASEPVLSPSLLADTLDARLVPVPRGAVRVGTRWTYRLRLQRTAPGWADLALSAPLMNTVRARAELGWTPQYSSTECLLELLRGMRQGEGEATAPLRPDASGETEVPLGRQEGRPVRA